MTSLGHNELIMYDGTIIFWDTDTPPHDDVIKWKHFLCYWPFVRGIHRSPVISPHKGQWHGALIFLWSAPWINNWVNNWEAGDLRRHHVHYDVIVMKYSPFGVLYTCICIICTCIYHNSTLKGHRYNWNFSHNIKIHFPYIVYINTMAVDAPAT